MYRLISKASLITRFCLCYATIEQYPIFGNATIQWLLGQIISIYTILRIIAYTITGNKILKYWINTSTWKSIIYFFTYLPLIGITYWILLLLTRFHILPF